MFIWGCDLAFVLGSGRPPSVRVSAVEPIVCNELCFEYHALRLRSGQAVQGDKGMRWSVGRL